MVRFVCVLLVLSLSACEGEQYWVRPSELTRARIARSSVEALRFEDDRPKTIAARRLLEIEIQPRQDGRLLATDWHTSLRHRRWVLLGTGIALIHVGFALTTLGLAWVDSGCPSSAPRGPNDLGAFSCLDLGVDKVGEGLIIAGVPTIVGGIALTVLGARVRVPSD